jgi:hypothetical protein
MPTDAQAHHRAALQADEDMRGDEPWLWHFANVMTWIINPWMSLGLCWLERSLDCTGARKELGESFQKEVAKILGDEAETGDCG